LDNLISIDELENKLFSQLYEYSDKSFNLNNSSLYQELDKIGLYSIQYTLKVNELIIYKDLTNYLNNINIFDYDKEIEFSNNLKEYLDDTEIDFNKIKETKTLINKWKINLDDFDYQNYN
jgi:hypothetical protein